MGVEERLREHLLRLLGDAERARESASRMAALDEMVAAWSDRLGLTSFDTEEERLRRYFLEAVSAYPFLPAAGPIVDIGSGGGSPALPLAILARETEWTLFESRQKKAGFLSEAVSSIGLANVEVVRRRFEVGGDRGRWAAATCRGVRVDARMMRAIESGLREGGSFLWFSAESRLAEAERSGETALWGRVRGPVALRAETEPGGALLVCTKAAT